MLQMCHFLIYTLYLLLIPPQEHFLGVESDENDNSNER
jgi:hypothetical protein